MRTRVYYDGLCHLCSREIDHYRRQKGAQKIQFVDITAEGFDAVLEGLNPAIVHKQIHAKREDGTLKTGVDAFVEIWDHLPRYQWAARIARIGFINRLLGFSYKVFAAIRPLLPRKKRDCSDSPYCKTNR